MTNDDQATSPINHPALVSAPEADAQVRVLFADDEAAVRALVSRVLGAMGWEVVAVPDGTQAVEVWEQDDRGFDLVILDLLMPSMNGVDASLAIGQRQPDTRFLFTSAYYDGQRLNSILRDGHSGFLPKPFLPAFLVSEARALLGLQPVGTPP